MTNTIVTAAERRSQLFLGWCDDHVAWICGDARDALVESRMMEALCNASWLMPDESLARLLDFLEFYIDEVRGGFGLYPSELSERLAAVGHTGLAELVTRQVADAVAEPPRSPAEMAQRWFRGEQFERQLAAAEGTALMEARR